MAKVYFTSDLHFGHKNLCNNLRGMSAEESDNLIIENWNKVVTKRDLVYVLGDLTMDDPSHLYRLLELKGNIVVVGGNHDTRQICKHLDKMEIEVVGALEYKGYICTHIPVHESCLDNFKGNIHGHIHLPGVFKQDEEGNEINWEYAPKIDLGHKYFNVNAEFHNYTPVLFDNIIDNFNSKTIWYSDTRNWGSPDIKVGDILIHDGVEYECVVSHEKNTCVNCSFGNMNCSEITHCECLAELREDGIEIKYRINTRL